MNIYIYICVVCVYVYIYIYIYLDCYITPFKAHYVGSVKEIITYYKKYLSTCFQYKFSLNIDILFINMIFALIINIPNID